MTKPTVKFKRLSGRQPVIVQILPALVRGGVERGTVEMAQAIQAAGGHALLGARHGAEPARVSFGRRPPRWQEAHGAEYDGAGLFDGTFYDGKRSIQLGLADELGEIETWLRNKYDKDDNLEIKHVKKL